MKFFEGLSSFILRDLLLNGELKHFAVFRTGAGLRDAQVLFSGGELRLGGLILKLGAF
jgi:hypothetical protein